MGLPGDGYKQKYIGKTVTKVCSIEKKKKKKKSSTRQCKTDYNTPG